MLFLLIDQTLQEGTGAVWAVLFSALLGASFTAMLVWFLTVRNRRLEEEKSKAALFYASKEAELMAREITNKAELEVERRWTELRRHEDRRKLDLERRETDVISKEQALHSEKENFEGKRERFERESSSLRQARQKLARMIRTYRRNLVQIANLTADNAKKLLLSEIELECADEIRRYRRELLDRSEKEIEAQASRKLLQAMQRLATHPNNDSIAAIVSLPNDDMKGRIIGREGRNIKCFEAATGTSVLIDESPNSLLISCFDPVRREIARLALESLIINGRIHPAAIEEAIGQATKRVDMEVIQYGEYAVEDLNLTGVHHEVLRLLGKLKYRFSMNQNVLDHSIEVAFLSSMIASEIGLDPVIAKRAGLFHDIGKAVDQEFEGSHAAVGAEILRRHGEPAIVVNAVAAHHEEIPSESLYAPLIVVADALSAARPGARADSQGLYLLRLERLEHLACSLPGVQEAYAIQAGREIRVIVAPEEVNDDGARVLARKIRRKIEDELEYPSVIKVTVIRERRYTETAK